MKPERNRIVFFFATLALCLLCSSARRALAVKVWNPVAGEVDLDDESADTPEDRFRHAAALITAGQAKSGIRQLKKLLRKHPEAGWSGKARYLIGMGYYVRGKHKKAYRALETFVARHPKSELIEAARQMQIASAGHRAEKSLNTAINFYDRLISEAESDELAAQCQKEKADAMLRAGRPMKASDAYLTLIDYYPDSSWVPYAWYRLGECEQTLARRIGRGSEYLDRASRHYKDFLANYPDHEYAPEAKKKLTEVRKAKAKHYREIAEYYMRSANRPRAALPYLQILAEDFNNLTVAKWASSEIKKLRQALLVPLRSSSRPTPLKGVKKQGKSRPGRP
ncbi:MAG: outer membrane protein assembly factor BamD [Candidatus Brocadiia bacterium]